MSKGVTPVVATVLLIGLAIASTTSVYQVYSQTTGDAGDVAEQIKLNSETVSFESCWKESGNTFLSVRNSGQNSLNATNLNLFLDGKIQPDSNYSISPEIVEPQRTMQVNIDMDISSDTQVKIGVEGNTIAYQCAF